MFKIFSLYLVINAIFFGQIYAVPPVLTIDSICNGYVDATYGNDPKRALDKSRDLQYCRICLSENSAPGNTSTTSPTGNTQWTSAGCIYSNLVNADNAKNNITTSILRIFIPIILLMVFVKIVLAAMNAKTKDNKSETFKEIQDAILTGMLVITMLVFGLAGIPFFMRELLGLSPYLNDLPILI
ncbi:hypothetical protein IPJ91_01375 [bacterium]|nr:MAG: hypothetical protein IPJ91_01375 [bacterium]